MLTPDLDVPPVVLLIGAGLAWAALGAVVLLQKRRERARAASRIQVCPSRALNTPGLFLSVLTQRGEHGRLDHGPCDHDRENDAERESTHGYDERQDAGGRVNGGHFHSVPTAGTVPVYFTPDEITNLARHCAGQRYEALAYVRAADKVSRAALDLVYGERAARRAGQTAGSR